MSKKMTVLVHQKTNINLKAEVLQKAALLLYERVVVELLRTAELL